MNQLEKINEKRRESLFLRLKNNIMKKYTIGFLFSEDGEWVVLIKKNRPDWQKGLLNGIGGHIEEGETPKECFIREFEEEAGIKLPESDVIQYATMKFKEAIIHCFKAFNGELLLKAKTKTDEYISFHEVDSIPYYKAIPNLKWLIPMALESIVDHAEINHSI